jgi:succinate dehydrogenase hydrophobic anchor subunit
MKHSRLWTLHLLCGLVLLFVMALHMGTFHLERILGWYGLSPLSYESVMARGKQLAYLFIYLPGLAAALFHGFYGLNRIASELGMGERAEKAVSTLLIISGFALFVFGAYVTVRTFVLGSPA